MGVPNSEQTLATLPLTTEYVTTFYYSADGTSLNAREIAACASREATADGSDISTYYYWTGKEEQPVEPGMEYQRARYYEPGAEESLSDDGIVVVIVDAGGALATGVPRTGAENLPASGAEFGAGDTSAPAETIGEYEWTGREIDAETELRYSRARCYDPTTGRWVFDDPFGFDAGDSNLFPYPDERAAVNIAGGGSAS